jgi:amidase
MPELGDILVVGPLARSAKDLDAVMQLITHPDKSQRTAWSLNLPEPRKKNLEDFRVGLWLDDPACPVDEAVGKRLQIFVDRLAKAGVYIEDRRPGIEFSKGLEVYVGLAAAISGANLPEGVFEKILAEAGQHQENETNIRARFIKGAVLSYRQWKLLDDERRSMQCKWAEFFKDYDVLLCPVAPVTAFEHDHTSFYDRELCVNNEQRSYVDTLQSWAGLTGIAYLPATVAPIGQTDEGLPVGIQIVGPYLEDRTAIHFAKLVEETFGGFRPPPLCDIKVL